MPRFMPIDRPALSMRLLHGETFKVSGTKFSTRHRRLHLESETVPAQRATDLHAPRARRPDVWSAVSDDREETAHEPLPTT